MIEIKICGVTNNQDALWAANLGADFIGLNFYPPSPRKVSPKNAKDIASQLPPFVTAVGIFVNEEISTVVKLIKSTPLKVVQFHGQETPEDCRLIKNMGIKVIKAIHLEKPFVSDDCIEYNDVVDYYLFDHASADTPGGTGLCFDWNWLQSAHELGKPWFLAGGLNADNAKEAILKTRAHAVDVCSGVERLPTRKDFEAMKRFIQTVRSIQ